MAPKRAAKISAPPPPPPVASSTETDSRSRSEESEDEETTAISLTPTSQKNPPAPPQKAEESEASDDEEEEEEDEEEEEPPRVAPPPAVKSQPPPPPPQPQQDEESEEGETESDEEEEEGETESDDEAPPTKPAPKQKADDPKPPSSVEAKKQAAPFRRVWSAEDEVRILEALAAHRREHGKLPQPDALVAALAGSLDNRSFGSKELFGKMKALRSRYTILAKRAEIPSKEHDRRVLDLCKIVWGPTAANAAAAPAPAATKANGHAPKEFDEMCEAYPFLAEEVNQLDAKQPGLFKRSFGMIDDDKASALDAAIKKQRVMQARAEMRRSDLAREVTKTLLLLLE